METSWQVGGHWGGNAFPARGSRRSTRRKEEEQRPRILPSRPWRSPFILCWLPWKCFEITTARFSFARPLPQALELACFRSAGGCRGTMELVFSSAIYSGNISVSSGNELRRSWFWGETSPGGKQPRFSGARGGDSRTGILPGLVTWPLCPPLPLAAPRGEH